MGGRQRGWRGGAEARSDWTPVAEGARTCGLLRALGTPAMQTPRASRVDGAVVACLQRIHDRQDIVPCSPCGMVAGERSSCGLLFISRHEYAARGARLPDSPTSFREPPGCKKALLFAFYPQSFVFACSPASRARSPLATLALADLAADRAPIAAASRSTHAIRDIPAHQDGAAGGACFGPSRTKGPSVACSGRRIRVFFFSSVVQHARQTGSKRICRATIERPRPRQLQPSTTASLRFHRPTRPLLHSGMSQKYLLPFRINSLTPPAEAVTRFQP